MARSLVSRTFSSAFGVLALVAGLAVAAAAAFASRREIAQGRTLDGVGFGSVGVALAWLCFYVAIQRLRIARGREPEEAESPALCDEVEWPSG